ncbi:BT_3987 domain-containing protein [Ornithobacterium rhinotracheale]|uniref:BT_3987 domain-containing protein n=1 Tax=Ornithobacterium rhinotracheale TaxID=28251 RepID=UPI004035E20A
MTNKKLIPLLFGGLLATAGIQSCEEKYDDLIPEEFNTVLLFKDSGETPLTLYDIGENGNYEFTIMKSGYKPESATNAEIRALSSEELAEYSKVTGKTYLSLPSSLYDLGQTNYSFSSSDTYKIANITLKTDEIKKFLENNGSNGNYVLPIKLEKINANDSVNSKSDLILLQPKVVTPVVSFLENSATLQIADNSAKQNVTLSLPFKSLWDFDATVTVDNSSLPSGYTIIPESQYTIANAGKGEFKVGANNSLPIEISIKNDGTLLGPAFALPLKINGASKPGIEGSKNGYILYAAFNAIPLTADMLSTNAQEPSEGPIANIIDNNPATFFHSVWSNAGMVKGKPHNIQINLKKSVTNFAFSYQNRNNENGKPTTIKVSVSNDGTSWRELKTLNDNLPTGASSKYNSPVMTSTDGAFQYVLLEVMKTNGGSAPTFFNMAELSVYGK